MLCRTSHRRCSIKKGVLKNFKEDIGRHLCQNLIFNKVAGLRMATLRKETLAHVFSFEFCEIFKSTFFTEHLWVTASGYDEALLENVPDEEIFRKGSFSFFWFILKRYCSPEQYVILFFQPKLLQKIWHLKKTTSRSKVMSVCFFWLWRHLLQTIKIGRNFLRDFLLYWNKKLFIFGQVFCQSSWYKMRKIIA